ncbi:MAG: protein arginine kinase activator, partial [Verrucomicrobiales bacterium]
NSTLTRDPCRMICDVCKEKTANVYLTQIVEGQMQKVNLCNVCSKEKGVSDPTGFALADLLTGIGTEKKLGRAGEEKTCESCGFTQTDFKKTGRLGCSHCYAIFGEGLDTLLKAMHKGTRHIGKAPKRFDASRRFINRIDDLKHRLRIAIADEDYEAAGTLRDKIAKAEIHFSGDQA